MAAEASDEPSKRNFLEEWKIARSILKESDEHLHDLRKYGFTFLTALLTAEMALSMPDHIKLAVLIVNFVLIGGLQILDRNYGELQRAAAQRAKILERILNLELTEVISQRYSKGNVLDFVTVLYVFFTVGVVSLGIAVLFPNLFFILILVYAGGITWMSVVALRRSIRVKYPHGEIDWILDRLQCEPGDEVAITLTNLSESLTASFPRGTIMWQIVKQDDEKSIDPVKTEEAHRCICIPPGGSYTWFWKTDKDLEPGICRVDRATRREKDDGSFSYPLEPLKKKLRIRKRV